MDKIEEAKGKVSFVDSDQKKRKLSTADIKVIATYNLQVNVLTEILPAEVQ